MSSCIVVDKNMFCIGVLCLCKLDSLLELVAYVFVCHVALLISPRVDHYMCTLAARANVSKAFTTENGVALSSLYPS